MDYQNRAGSKKGSGGIASSSQENLHRRKQVEDLLKDGEEVPYSFQGISKEDEELSKKNPYIYKNHAGRLVCKLCNTIHMSWTSVERHLEGKKHGLNLIRRGGNASAQHQEAVSPGELRFKKAAEELRSQMKDNGIVPNYQVAKVRDPTTNERGIAMRVIYTNPEPSFDSGDRPYVRVMSSLEFAKEEDDKKYLIIAFEPFKTIAVEIPNQELSTSNTTFNTSGFDSVDEFNSKYTYWDDDEQTLYVQFFFKD
ncbi:LAQU0S03e06986g1_1 [Lachancea quebecensis]|uniref:LAQU0S03e06986g1_1 n=1 Tax=Lachancea quebecensis TaxID=1654605 RepID=A0A0P1KNK8_9SACH|nr:LAQU0S03e06986g1_1 [Lachancea quebecensis]